METGVTETSLPEATVCVLKYALERWAAEQPERTFVCFEDGETWSYGEMLARTRRLAAALQELGVGQGDHVVVWLPNGREGLVACFAINYIGAVYVPINIAYRGPLLAHVIGNAGAAVMVAHGGLAERLGEIDRGCLETLVSVGPQAPAVPGLRILAFDAIQKDDRAPAAPDVKIEPWHTQSIIFTSGTTGPSKGVLSSYRHAYVSMNDAAWPSVSADDRFLINMPFFHIGGNFITYSMLYRGASITLSESFRTDSFWRTVRETEATNVCLLGAMAPFLLKAPATPADRDHCLRSAIIVPLNAETEAFADRFGVEVYTLFNMTEASTPLFSEANPSGQSGNGYCGTARAGVELRIVDENDHELPDGEVGELIMRTAEPWCLNHGYNGNPEATAQAWRNGWFHTGDAMRRDAAGRYYFVDRKKDAIRRRGENISSAEVELVVMSHDAVAECAAIGVPSEFGEDDVMVVLALKQGQALAPEDLLAYLQPRMAHFMVPRYLRFMADLPLTPTAKVRKAELRRHGITEDTWDREAAGIKIRADRLS